MQKRIITWYIAVLISLLLMILIGGVTRLTDSGLSMVDWKLLLDVIPPLTESSWQNAFNAYKQFPEYTHYHSHFSLSDFKFIYFWEYLHRFFARILGLIFIVPFLVFWLKGRFEKKEKRYLCLALLCGIFQAFIGWYMVKSGLRDLPDISHFRLALHLSVAFLIVVLIAKAFLQRLYPIKNRSLTVPFMIGTGLFILTFVQVVIGAFVSGLKAGYAFNTWPKMGSEWIPENIFYLQPFYENFLKNGFAIQFLHRHLGVVILVATLGFAATLWKQKDRSLKYLLPTLLLLVSQVLLGIFTLVMHVPLVLASLHQLTATILLASFVYYLHQCQQKPIKKTKKSLH
ncbi:MAG: COX15/CtaA family protein [bacterium]